MKILLWLITVIVLLHSREVPTQDPFKKITYFKLTNGLQVYLLNDEKAENTQILLNVNVGYDVETEKTYGLTHLVEHMVFRDQRVPYHDYLDYIKEEGGTHVNGYTKRYKTGYLTTIDSNKSYWIVKTFASMIFDKNITKEDIRIEKGALQTEIGEPHWYFKPLWYFKTFFKKILPKKDNLYQDEFSLATAKELPARYFAQENNQHFSLKTIMEHYHKYYYPANMTLTVAGNFSLNTMETLIKERYGQIQLSGNDTVKKPNENPQLNHNPYKRFYEGGSDNTAYIGTKYILDDYKKYLILDIYTSNLAERLQQEMRNQNGKTYSVNPYSFTHRKAGIASITFDALHDDFEENIRTAKRTIQADLNTMSNLQISKALKSYEQKYYTSLEHDSKTLMELVDMQKYLREDQNITNETSYSIFKSITPKAFKEVLHKVFIAENSYTLIYRDYYFFPLEMLVLSLLAIFLFIYIYILWSKGILQKKGLRYTQRDVLFQRRVSSRFMGFLIFTFTIILVSILWDWIQCLLLTLLFDDPYYLMTITPPYSYIFTILDPLLYMLLFIMVFKRIWRYYARIDIIDKAIVAIGNRVLILPKEKITHIDIVKWKPAYYRHTVGTSFRFWHRLVRIELDTKEFYYLRTSQAEHLKEDIERWVD